MKIKIYVLYTHNSLKKEKEKLLNNSAIGQVLAVFTEVGINPTLYFLVFGESLLNGLSCIYRLSEVKLKEHLYF